MNSTNTMRNIHQFSNYKKKINWIWILIQLLSWSQLNCNWILLNWNLILLNNVFELNWIEFKLHAMPFKCKLISKNSIHFSQQHITQVLLLEYEINMGILVYLLFFKKNKILTGFFCFLKGISQVSCFYIPFPSLKYFWIIEWFLTN